MFLVILDYFSLDVLIFQTKKIKQLRQELRNKLQLNLFSKTHQPTPYITLRSSKRSPNLNGPPSFWVLSLPFAADGTFWKKKNKLMLPQLKSGEKTQMTSLKCSMSFHSRMFWKALQKTPQEMKKNYRR